MSKYYPFDPADAEFTEEEAFEYLENLRDSGETNMWGATPYMEAELGMEQAEAKYWFLRWIKSFDKVDEVVEDDEYVVP